LLAAARAVVKWSIDESDGARRDPACAVIALIATAAAPDVVRLAIEPVRRRRGLRTAFLLWRRRCELAPCGPARAVSSSSPWPRPAAPASFALVGVGLRVRPAPLRRRRRCRIGAATGDEAPTPDMGSQLGFDPKMR
jgi:hypothetical protein